MISSSDLSRLARARLADARVLLRNGRHDGAAYMAGYAVELALKHRICRTLRWAGFPERRGEFEGYASLRTHDFGVLLRFSGQEARVLARLSADWQTCTTWNPEMRYRVTGTTTPRDAQAMVESCQSVMRMVLG